MTDDNQTDEKLTPDEVAKLAKDLEGQQVHVKISARGWFIGRDENKPKTEERGLLENHPGTNELKLWRDGHDSFGRPIRVGTRIAYREITEWTTL